MKTELFLVLFSILCIFIAVGGVVTSVASITTTSHTSTSSTSLGPSGGGVETVTLLDIQTNIPDQYKILHPGDNLLFSVSLFNFGNAGRVDVNLTYGIRNSTTEILMQKTELAVENSILLQNYFALPKDLAPRKYQLFATAEYANTTATASTDFTVVKPAAISYALILMILIAVFGILCIFVAVLAFKNYMARHENDLNLKKIGSSLK